MHPATPSSRLVGFARHLSTERIATHLDGVPASCGAGCLSYVPWHDSKESATLDLQPNCFFLIYNDKSCKTHCASLAGAARPLQPRASIPRRARICACTERVIIPDAHRNDCKLTAARLLLNDQGPRPRAPHTQHHASLPTTATSAGLGCRLGCGQRYPPHSAAYPHDSDGFGLTPRCGPCPEAAVMARLTNVRI